RNDRRKFCRQYDYNRSGHRLTGKGRVRFMTSKKPVLLDKAYPEFISQLVGLLEQARRNSARSVNAIMTATYWEIGRRIVEQEQRGQKRAQYGKALLHRLAGDLTARFGKGFSERNLLAMREFFLAWSIPQTVSAESSEPGRTGDTEENPQTASAKSAGLARPSPFPLPWSHYVRLLSVNDRQARDFYEAEALRGGWSVRQLDRQIATQFFERTQLSRNKAALLRRGQPADPTEQLTPEQEIKDPFVLEFLGLKDEYSENALEEALIHRLQEFLLELGSDFAFLARQRRLRVGDEWYRIDLLFFHRRLRCLVIIDLKIGKFTHADAGQMNLYLNYAREHWTLPDENPPLGLILCSEKNEAVAHYALGNLHNKVLSSQYKLALPGEKELAKEIAKTRKALLQQTQRDQ
ncbi:MAG TPA: PDDEXK nuclease domain-containing protein, partial [Candidatus Acidoferrum sp.]|nr:PDDEXK nuclease domain-containing protein [Candidatus Acidoferrum sp.]